eukprot:1159584-Pelagomonas_calceolata.AAC.8
MTRFDCVRALSGSGAMLRAALMSRPMRSRAEGALAKGARASKILGMSVHEGSVGRSTAGVVVVVHALGMPTGGEGAQDCGG